MNDDALYHQYRRLVAREGLRRRSIRWFVVSVIFAALLLLIAVHFNMEAGFPGWFIAAGMMASAMGTVAVRNWNLNFHWMRLRWARFTLFLVFYLVCAGIARWINPQNPNGSWKICWALTSSLGLGQYLAFWVTNAKTILPPRQDKTDPALNA